MVHIFKENIQVLIVFCPGIKDKRLGCTSFLFFTELHTGNVGGVCGKESSLTKKRGNDDWNILQNPNLYVLKPSFPLICDTTFKWNDENGAVVRMKRFNIFKI